MLRRLVTLVVVLLIGHAGWKVGPPYLHYFEFKAKLDETARFSGDRSEREILARVVEVARALELPVTEQSVRVRQQANHIYIDVSYTQPLEVLPRYFYPWAVTISVDAWQAR